MLNANTSLELKTLLLKQHKYFFPLKYLSVLLSVVIFSMKYNSPPISFIGSFLATTLTLILLISLMVYFLLALFPLLVPLFFLL